MTSQPSFAESSQQPAPLLLTEVDSAKLLATKLFSSKFQGPPPDRGRHFVALGEVAPGQWSTLSYVHFQPFGDTCLVGGACTDGQVLRKLGSEKLAAIKAKEGPYAQLLRYAFAKTKNDFFAFFGHTSDARATLIDLSVGFRRTNVEHLLIYTPGQLDATLERALIAKIASIGPF